MKKIIGHPNLMRDDRGVIHVRQPSKIDLENIRKRKMREQNLENEVAQLKVLVSKLLKEKN